MEKDSMGPVKVPKEAYYGAQTQRAVENFPISGWRFQREMILCPWSHQICLCEDELQSGAYGKKDGQGH